MSASYWSSIKIRKLLSIKIARSARSRPGFLNSKTAICRETVAEALRYIDRYVREESTMDNE